MSMPVWLPYAITWLLSTLLGGAAVYGAMRAKLAGIEAELANIKSEIGTRNTGLRGAVHDHSGALLRLDGRLTALEDR